MARLAERNHTGDIAIRRVGSLSSSKKTEIDRDNQIEDVDSVEEEDFTDARSTLGPEQEDPTDTKSTLGLERSSAADEGIFTGIEAISQWLARPQSPEADHVRTTLSPEQEDTMVARSTLGHVLSTHSHLGPYPHQTSAIPSYSQSPTFNALRLSHFDTFTPKSREVAFAEHQHRNGASRYTS